VQLAVGLGNPGDRYLHTRHNVGFRVVEALARAFDIETLEERFFGAFGASRPGFRGGDSPQLPAGLVVLCPHTFMNRSGESVAAALDELPIGDLTSDLAVVVDDLDLPFGRLRIRPSGGAGGHRGLESVIDHLGTKDFPRLRFGIGRPERGEDPVEYVLARFGEAEEQELDARIQLAASALTMLFRDGVEAAMNHFNRPPEPRPPQDPSGPPKPL
jgi:PTH1 family peptidyl-tRNA hydrolase